MFTIFAGLMENSALTDTDISGLISGFKIDVNIASVHPFGSGHINDSYRIINSDADGADYLLQRVNHHVFQDVPALMQNLQHVTDHLKKKLALKPNAETEKEVLSIIPTKDGRPYLEDEEGNYWRMFLFLKDTRSYDRVETPKQAYEGGKAFGRFQALLADLDTGLIADTIPDFHNIESRLAKLKQAVEANTEGRAQRVIMEIIFIKQRVPEMSELLALGKAGIIPQRIVHNDTKFNNVLLNSKDKAQCVIDLDTVMPGYVAYDFGDSIRTIINTAAEDEAEVKKVDLDIPLFEAYAQGYLKEAIGFLTKAEVDSLMKGVLLLPYMQAVRFLTDYLEGDHYFKIHSPDHNLQRTRAQLALVKKLEDNEAILQKIISKTRKQYK